MAVLMHPQAEAHRPGPLAGQDSESEEASMGRKWQNLPPPLIRGGGHFNPSYQTMQGFTFDIQRQSAFYGLLKVHSGTEGGPQRTISSPERVHKGTGVFEKIGKTVLGALGQGVLPWLMAPRHQNSACSAGQSLPPPLLLTAQGHLIRWMLVLLSVAPALGDHSNIRMIKREMSVRISSCLMSIRISSNLVLSKCPISSRYRCLSSGNA